VFKSLQAARAVAAGMVVLFHLGSVAEKYFGLPLTADWGRAGVEFFFVLSGFIITNAHWADIGRPERLARFAWKRFVRIYPTYWMVFLLVFALAFRVVNVSAYEALRALTLAPTGATPILTVAWSLHWEMVFYTLFALLIVHPAFALAAFMAAAVWMPNSPYYLLLFLLGVGCARLAQRDVRIPGWALAVVGAAGYGVACHVEASGGNPTAIAYGIAASVLILGLVRSEIAGHVFGAHPQVQLLGDASYSIYLVHYPIISAIFKAAMALGLHSPAAGSGVYALALLVAPGVGIAFHLLVERPVIARLQFALPFPRIALANDK